MVSILYADLALHLFVKFFPSSRVTTRHWKRNDQKNNPSEHEFKISHLDTHINRTIAFSERMGVSFQVKTQIPLEYIFLHSAGMRT